MPIDKKNEENGDSLRIVAQDVKKAEENDITC